MAIYHVDLYNGNDTNDGLSWGGAFLTFSKMSTINYSSGDQIKISKTPDPISIGNALWTNSSGSIELPIARTKTIENCENLWIGSTNVTINRSTIRKQGAYSATITASAAFTIGKIAYKTITELNLSFYDSISFWFRSNSAIAGNLIKICLCSDEAGDVVIDEFTITDTQNGTNRFRPITLAKDGGGYLGTSIKSIAVYQITDNAGIYFQLDNIIACNINDLHLQSLISKNGNPTESITHSWYCIKSIDENIITIDSHTEANPTLQKGYSGETETVETYIRTTYKTIMGVSSTTSNGINIAKSGSPDSYILVDGGYDPITDVQNGSTWIDGVNGMGRGININSGYNKISNIGVCRYYSGVLFVSSSTYNRINNISSISCTYGIENSSNATVIIENLNHINNNHIGIALVDALACSIENINNINENIEYGIYTVGTNGLIVDNIKNMLHNTIALYMIDSSYSIFNGIELVKSLGNFCYYQGCYENIISNATIDIGNFGQVRGGSLVVNNILSINNKMIAPDFVTRGYIKFLNYNRIQGNNFMYDNGAEYRMQSDVVYDTQPVAWRIDTFSQNSYVNKYTEVKFAEVAIDPFKQVTVTIPVMMENPNLFCELFVQRNDAIGIIRTSSIKTADTNWELLTINFTSTSKGVAEIFIKSHNGGALGSLYYIYVGSISITQAD